MLNFILHVKQLILCTFYAYFGLNVHMQIIFSRGCRKWI